MSVQEIIINQTLEQLEKGIVPWQCPYRRVGLPQNGINQRTYNGINVLLLSQCNYPSNKFFTYDNVSKLGGYVKQGEHSNMVVAYFPKTSKKEVEVNGEMVESEKTSFFLKYYRVFNLSQTSLWNNDETIESVMSCDNDKLNEFISKITYTQIEFASSEIPCFSPSLNVIKMPPLTHFKSEDEYYSVLFHELIHSAVHQLKVKMTYANEELVAEIGSSILCQTFGVLFSIENKASYIAGWSKQIKEKKNTLLSSANLAMTCVKYLLEG